MENKTPDTPGKPRVEFIGRFGNYFYAQGWRLETPGHISAVQYAFEENGASGTPEFSFIHPRLELVRADEAGIAQPTLSRYLDLLWISEGWRLNVSQELPVTVTIPDAAPDGQAQAVKIQDLRDDDFPLFLDALESTGNKGVWTNRVVLEMVGLQDDAGKLRFFRKAVDHVGWRTMAEAFGKLLGQDDDGVSVPLYLEFYCHCISSMPRESLPPDLRTKFADLVGRLDVSTVDHGLLNDVTCQLAVIDHERACRFSQTVIASLNYGRKELAAYIQHCLPSNSCWWIRHVLENQSLGPEQAADALNAAGTAAATQGQTDLAMLCYEASMRVDPQSQSAAWNMGWLFAEKGRFDQAEKAFGRLTRHYCRHSLSTRWPHLRDMPWPAAAMVTEGFTLPDHVTRWPRITVITPSYNQCGFIEESILSVLNQGYPDLQYIMVDGNSDDGTREILERYRDRFNHLVIEPDSSQTEAINKGLRLADGDIVAWLNSDDMQAPGTLHRAALAWLENKPDVIAGICVEHSDRRFLVVNKPAGSDADFNIPQLARIFKYWFKGHYFYQPEVFFSRNMLDKVGLLDESLHYTMDYDLWLRFAKAGAALEVVDWPFAFFRKHESQKTSNLIDCIEEQARVRGHHYELPPNEECLHRVRRRLALFQRKPEARIGILSNRAGRPEQSDGVEGGPCLCDDETDPRIIGADAVIVLVDPFDSPGIIQRLRSGDPDRLIIGWFMDHSHPFENHSVAEAVDIVVTGDAAYGGYLRNDQSFFLGHVPTPVMEWARHGLTSLIV